MGLTPDDYLQQIQSLLPPGPAWPRDADAYVTRLLRSLAEEFARVDVRATDLLDEADPRTTVQLLLDWERIAGLPDGCVVDSGVELSTAQRQAALVGRVTMVGDQSAAYFQQLAASLGYVVQVTDFSPFDVTDLVSEPIYGVAWAHAWQVRGSLNQPVDFTAVSTVADALSAWSNVVLECVLRRFKPAHSVLIFSYT